MPARIGFTVRLGSVLQGVRARRQAVIEQVNAGAQEIAAAVESRLIDEVYPAKFARMLYAVAEPGLRGGVTYAVRVRTNNRHFWVYERATRAHRIPKVGFVHMAWQDGGNGPWITAFHVDHPGTRGHYRLGELELLTRAVAAQVWTERLRRALGAR